MSRFIFFEAEEEETYETDQLLSDSSQAAVSGSASPDEKSLDGDYDTDFVDEDSSDDSLSCNFHLDETDVYRPGLPIIVANHLPKHSFLSNLMYFSDGEFYSRKTNTMPPRKSKTLLKFEEKAANMKKKHPASEMSAESAAKLDAVIEAQLDRKRKEASKKAASLQAMKEAEAEQIDVSDSEDASVDEFENGSGGKMARVSFTG